MTWLMLAAGNPITEITTAFGVDLQKFVSQVVLFLLIAFLLKKFAYGPIQEKLEERRTKIAEGLAQAEKSRVELANAQAKAQELLNQASAQANQVIAEARAAAARITEQESQKAVVAAQDIVNKARQANEAEIARLKAELRREIGGLAVKAAIKVTGKVLTAEDQQRLIDQTNREIAA